MNFLRKTALYNILPKPLNRIYWLLLPHNVSYHSGERNIPVCLVSKRPENKLSVSCLTFALL